MEQLLCGCGCGELVKTIGRKYVYGHLSKLVDKKIECACGCGEQIQFITSKRGTRMYKNGHNSKLQPKAEEAFNWKGGKRINYQGYIVIYKQDHPLANNTGYVLEHRWIVEQNIGRYLEPWEDVHHKNGNKLDNRLENLQLMTHGEHMRLEMTVDMSNRKCSLCNSRETYINTLTNRPVWYRHRDLIVCGKCYRKDYHKRIKLNKK